jgi:4-carboxymuconolactone decarboxylase
VKHWHGATRSSAMTHVAIAEAQDGIVVRWLEPVTDAQYQGPE